MKFKLILVILVVIAEGAFGNQVSIKSGPATVSIDIGKYDFVPIKSDDIEIRGILKEYLDRRLDLEKLAMLYDTKSAEILTSIRADPKATKGWNEVMERIQTIEPMAKLEGGDESWMFILINKGLIDERIQILGMGQRSDGSICLRHGKFSMDSPAYIISEWWNRDRTVIPKFNKTE